MDTAPASGEVRGIDREPVTAWLTTHVEGATPPFSFRMITGGHSNLTYAVTDSGGRQFVLRRPPLGAVLATAHDMAREHRIISAVAHTAVPVPRAVALCTDTSVNGAPFYVMNFVDGHVLEEPANVEQVLPDPARRRALSESVVDALAALHTADVDAIGLGDLARRDAYLDRQLKRWRGQWEKSKTRELATMEEVYEALVAGKPEQRYTGIVHGDYRLGNMLARADGSIAAVLDWELCTLGDVLADVGYLLNNWAEPGEEAVRMIPTAAGGFLRRDEMVHRYAEKTGFAVRDIEYYRAFQYWRLAAIVEGVASRYLQGVMGDPGADATIFQAQVDLLATQALVSIRAAR
jgi:aminoglycoside phosphotransferase (APT) family kinase protein